MKRINVIETPRIASVGGIAATLALLVSGVAPATDYQWTGAVDSNWQDAGNWAGGAIPAFNTSGAHRLNVNSATKLLYTAAEGTTVYANNGTGTRGLVIGSGGLGSGELEITGGSFSTLGSTAGDVIGNGAGNTAILTLNGGDYTGTAAGTNLGIGGGPTSTLNVLAGTATVATLTLNATTATVNLSGTGALAANSITRAFGPANITFDGGTLQARISTAAFLQGLTTATVNGGGLTVDTNGNSIALGQALLAGAGSGGLTKTGSGNLTLTGASTFTGLTSVNNGQLLLNTTGGGALAGDVSLTSTSTSRTYLQLLQSDQLPATATLDLALTGSGTVYADLALQGNSQTLAALNPTWDQTVTGGNVFIENRVFGDNGGGNGVLTIDGSTDSTWGSRVLVRDGQSGTLSLGKSGSGVLTLGSANTYTGTTTIDGGILKLGVSSNATTSGPLGSSTGNTTVQGGGTLDFDGFRVYAEQLVISGTGVGGDGALVNTGADQTNAVQNLVLGGNATVGGTGRWDLRQNSAAPTLDMAGHTLTKKGTNRIALVGTTVSNPGNIDITEGIFDVQTSSSIGGSSANVATVRGGATLGFYQTSNPVDWSVNLEDNATILGQSGTGSENAIAGPIALTSGTAILQADAVLNLSGSISGAGGLNKIGTSTATLTGTNSYAGATSVAAGVLELGSAAALGSTASVSVTSGATLRLATATAGSGTSVTINGSGGNFYGALQGTASSSVAWAGNVVLGSSGARIGGGEGGTLAVDGVISDGGNGFAVLFSRAANSTTVLNSVNTYTGDTQLFPNSSTTTLRMGVANAIDSGSRLTFSSSVSGTANIDLNGFDQNVRSVVDTFAANMIVTNGGSADAVLTLSESNAANTATFDGWIEDGVTNKVSLIKAGAGTQILSGPNTYTGATTVSGGTLLVNGSLAATTVSVGSAATLGGSGTLAGPVSILAGGILSPGNSPGTLTVNNTLALAGTSILEFEIDATSTSPGGLNDLITGVTDLTLGGTLNLSGTGDFTTIAQGTTWRLIDYTGSFTNNTMAIGTVPTLAAGLSFAIDTSTANEVNLVVVPEPAGILLAMAGIAAAAVARRRR